MEKIKIENETTSIVISKENPELKAKYTDLLFFVVNRPVSQGMTIKEMKNQFELLDAIEKAEDEIILTKEQLKKVVEEVNKVSWTIVHKDIVTFAEKLEKSLENK